MDISYLELQQIRLQKNGLSKHFPSVEVCVKSLCGIQSQYQMYAVISLFNRVCDFQLNDFFDNTNLIKSWGQRTTLHIFHKDDYSLISSIYKDVDNWVYKYAKSLNVDYKECLLAIKKYFVNSPKLVISKKELTEILPTKHKKELMQWSGMLILAALHQILYGVVNSKDEKLYSINKEVKDISTKKKIIEKYFKYYSPASISDFLHWAGLKKRDVEVELSKYLQDKSFFNIDSKKYYYDELPNDMILEYPLLLGKFDPLLVGYKNKKWILGNYDSNIIWKKAGQVEGAILSEKGLIGTWHYILKTDSVIYEVLELEKISEKTKKAINKKFKAMNKLFDKKANKIIYLKGEQ